MRFPYEAFGGYGFALKRADGGLYAAKQGGRNRVVTEIAVLDVPACANVNVLRVRNRQQQPQEPGLPEWLW